MSEKHTSHHEKGIEHHKKHEHQEHHSNHQERELTEVERQHGSDTHLEQLAKNVEQQAVSGKEVSHSESERKPNHPVLVNKQLKDMAFARAMTRTRKRLSPTSRAFSKIVHVPFVDKSSEFIGKTVARPTAMLWGAVFAFIGTSALLWITRHYGYEYNYLVAIILFVSGAVLGMAFEVLTYFLRKKEN